MENFENKIITEHPEGGTEIAFGHAEQLHKEYESLQLQISAEKDDSERLTLQEKANKIAEELGLEESITH